MIILLMKMMIHSVTTFIIIDYKLDCVVHVVSNLRALNRVNEPTNLKLRS